MKNKNITIEDLAGMVKKGFDGADKRFDGVDGKLKEIDIRLDHIENLILKQYSRRIETLEMRIKRLEEALALK